MARTYLSTLSPRRRWGIAGSAAGVAFLLTAGLGNPWTSKTIDTLSTWPGARDAPNLVNTLGALHWTPSQLRFGNATAAGPARAFAVVALDLAWPLLLLFGVRLLAGGLATRRARLAAFCGVWGLTVLAGALGGVLAALTGHWLNAGVVLPDIAVQPGAALGDLLTTQAAATAMLAAALGWLPALAAVIAYSAGRGPVPAAAGARSADTAEAAEPTLIDPRTTLDLAGLESIRRAKRRGGQVTDNTLTDVRTSPFFADQQK
jgi:hypothetical protein